MKEVELYPIVKRYFESLGYLVKAEVEHVDVMCVKDVDMILIEMKRTLNDTLIYQGIQRLKLSNEVYLAIEKPTNKVLHSTSFKQKIEIVKHLRMGLLLIDLKKGVLEIMMDANTQVRNRVKKRVKLLKEFHARQLDINIGGSHQTKIMTAYKELSLLIVHSLKSGPLSIKEIKNIVAHHKVSHVLQKNYHHYFKRISRGVYELTEEGYQALNEFESIKKRLN